MPQVVRVQVILNPTEETRDQVMNTWHCVTVGATTPLAAVTAFATALTTFYGAIDSELSSELTGKSPLARGFDLSHPKPRQPIYEGFMGTLSCGVAPAVRELCVCLSYKGTYLSGVSPKRKRGRIYLGPLAANTISSGEVASAAVTVFKNAAQTLLTASDASSQYRWVIYSPTTDSAGTGLDLDSWDAVTEGWVDNNVDIQRRRGFSGGTRSTFT